MSRREDDGPAESFFIGWAEPPAALKPFLGRVAAGTIVLFAAVAWLVAATQDDPGGGAFRWDLGPQTVTGVLTVAPYPVLHVTASESFPPGTALMLSRGGKRGVAEAAEPLAGRLVSATGIPLSRGTLTMLQIGGGAAALEAAGPRLASLPRRDLGRWRLTGEICDGKCLTGAMRPGTGLAHKACANLCIRGGVPPVFVSSGPVEGLSFFLLAGPGGGPLPEEVLTRTGELLEIEGQIEMLGAMPVLRVDPASAGAPG